MAGMKKDQDPGCIVRLRGLPWATRKDEIIKFLAECQIAGGEEGIHFIYSREGRPSGEAFVELISEDDVSFALAQNREHIGSRYIEVFRVDRSEMEWKIKRAGANVACDLSMPDAVVKLRGLPFGCSKEEIAQFFAGLEIVPNGIMLPEDHPGRGTGDAFVQFSSPEIAEKALEKHKERIGHRYIEIFKSSMGEANSMGPGRGGIRPLMWGPRPGPYDRGDRFGMGAGPMVGMGYGRGRGRNLKGYYDDDYDDYGFGSGGGYGARNRHGGPPMRGRGGMGHDRRGMHPGGGYMSETGHSVHMRGLPFQALEQDVFEFFNPLKPVRCEFEFGHNGRPTGEANVDFGSHQEAVEAMKKHKCNMHHRYIELFLNSEPGARNGSGMGGGMGGGNMGGNDSYDDMGGRGFNQGNGPFGGGFGGGNQGFGQNQGNFGNQEAFGNENFGQGLLNILSGYLQGFQN